MNTRVSGIVLTCIAFLAFSVMDAVMKWIGGRAGVGQAFFVSSVAAVLFLLSVELRKGGWAALRTHHFLIHAARGIGYLVQFSMVIYSFRHMTLANFYALIFTAPFFVTVLSAILLRERADARQWSATMIGFLGVLIVLRPTSDIDIVGLMVLGAAAIYAVDVICMQYTGKLDTPGTVMLYPTLVALLPGVVYGYLDAKPISTIDFGLLLVAGVLMGIGVLMLAIGFKRATTPVAAPFHYTQLIWGVLFGYFVWDELPDVWTALGATIIVASGLYILRRETSMDSGAPDPMLPHAG